MATYSTTSRFALRYAATSNKVLDFAAIQAALASDIDAAMLGYSTGTAAGMPAAGTAGRIYYQTDTGSWWLDNGSMWRRVTGISVSVPHIVNYDDQTSPPVGVVILGRVPVTLKTVNQAAILLGVKHLCTTVGSTPTSFKIQNDAAAIGTLADTPGLGTTAAPLLPAATASHAWVPATSPVSLPDGSQIVFSAVVAGGSKGCNLAPVVLYVAA